MNRGLGPLHSTPSSSGGPGPSSGVGGVGWLVPSADDDGVAARHGRAVHSPVPRDGVSDNNPGTQYAHRRVRLADGDPGRHAEASADLRLVRLQAKPCHFWREFWCDRSMIPLKLGILAFLVLLASLLEVR